MRITDLETILAARSVYVRVHTNEGITGLGEAGLPQRGRTVQAAIGELGRHLKGKDPLRIEHHWQSMYSIPFFRGGPVMSAALSAVDIALWDIAGKHFNTPVYGLLGGECRDRVRVYVHIGDREPDELAEKAANAVKEGYTAVRFSPFLEGFQKMRYGKLIETAVSQVKAVRDAVGDEVDICIDAHGRLTPYEAISLGREVEKYRIFFYEDPILPENIDAMADIVAHTNIPIATGERLFYIWQFWELLKKKAVHMVRPDLCLAGGISQCKKIAAMAEACYVKVVPHNPLSAVSTAACVQLDACIPNFVLQELIPDGLYEGPPRHSLVKKPLEIEKGYIKVPTDPGLGVELDESKLAEYPFEDRDPPWLLREDGSVADW